MKQIEGEMMNVIGFTGGRRIPGFFTQRCLTPVIVNTKYWGRAAHPPLANFFDIPYTTTVVQEK
jgi:hypothetical protein